MKTETANGQEQYEEFYSRRARKFCVQYDYRTPEGKLFKTVAPTLEMARERRDEWLEFQKEINQ